VYLIAEGGMLNWILGEDPTRAGTPRMQWANFPESWGVFVLIAILILIAVGVFWLYRREINTCPMPVKLVLAGLRLAVLLSLVALFLKPSIFYQQVNEVKPTIAILRDASLSFARGDKYRSPEVAAELAKTTGLEAAEIESGEVDRARLLNRAINNDQPLLDKLRDKGSVRVINFADGIQPVALIPATRRQETGPHPEPPAADSKQDSDGASGLIRETIPDLVPDGLGTDIWQALRATLDDANRLSAIVLVSDFQHNGSEDPLELARRAAQLEIPIFTVGIGDPNPPKNISVNEVYVRNKTYPDEPFEIETTIQSTEVGNAGTPEQVRVQLLQQRVDPATGNLGPSKEVKTKDISLPAKGGRVRFAFEHVLNEPGQYVFDVRTEPLENESETDDNSKLSSILEVADEKVRVLLISGLPNWDYQQVQRLLQRDPNISLSCWLQSMDETRPQEGNEPITRLPRTIEEMGQYNVILMIDPDPQEFDAEWMDQLEAFCRFKAGGVMYMAGPQFTSEFVTMNRLKKIREILPVQFGDTDYIATRQALAIANNDRKGRMLIVNHNLDHPVMSFRSDPAETQKIWDQMPGILWNFPTLAAKPTARVLMERGEQVGIDGNQPLLVTGRFGAGSVLYAGFQGTWRWRPVGLQAQYFDRFWIQVIRYLVETRSLQGSRRGFVDTDKNEYELGDRIVFIARLLDQQFQPSNQPEVDALIRTSDGRTQKVPMKMLPQQPGRYEGTFVAQRTGSYAATLDMGGGEDAEELIEPISFRVVPPSAESGAFWLNEKLMLEIASLSGGQSFKLDEFEQLADNLPRLVTRAEFNSPPEPIWDINRYFRFFAFLLPVVLLTIEWSLRKWFKLL
jgi:hypothetical protein